MSLTVWAVVGFTGQALFFSRFFLQWIVSEKRKESVVPVYFWYLSVGGAVLVLCYSLHIRDPVFIVGQVIGLLIYLRNLSLIQPEKFYKKWWFVASCGVLLTCFVLILYYGKKAAKGMLPLGFAGQVIFTARFVIQWYASERKRESFVPPFFWYTSLVGGLLLLWYAIQIKSAVFILGQSMGALVYTRNLLLIRRKAARQMAQAKSEPTTEFRANNEPQA